MTNEELMTALYDKVDAEQQRLRDYLMARGAGDVLCRAYEFAMREDICCVMEDIELTDAQAEALLASPSPLADLYRELNKVELGVMETIREVVENRANTEIKRQREEQRAIPLYTFSGEWARQKGEQDAYRVSRQANLACKAAIEEAISQHYRDNRLDPVAAKDVLDRFGPERVQYVLAVTVGYNSWDGRYSTQNKQWAKGICIVGDGPDEHSDRNFDLRVGSHPGLVDLFITQVRQELDRERKPSVHDKLQQPAPTPKPKKPKKGGPELT